ncbi:MAG: glycerate kinase [Clostridia bacterium]|nr:glycerate kinase [Clostridia bacterium]
MKVVIAIDSLKGSLTSLEAGAAVAAGVKRVFPDAETTVRPIADGGEGTVDALIEGLQGKRQRISVTGPLGEPVVAEYGIVEQNTAVIEMSAAAGITLVPDSLRNPMNTTTYGVGEMILDAIQKGCRNFIIGIGGSATNDGGVGMLQALGFGMLDKEGIPVPLGGKGLEVLHSIVENNVIPELAECRFHIACDVTNPLCGENGCSAVYGPQKGADTAMISDMDHWLSRYAELAKTVSAGADKDHPGAGAAGGIGFAFLAFLNGELKNGIELVLRETELERYVADADYVVTGEGRLDSQTVMGKVPVGVAKIAKKYRVPVLAFAGAVTPEAGLCNQHGIDAFFPILRRVSSLEEAMEKENAETNLTDTAEQVFRLIRSVEEG